MAAEAFAQVAAKLAGLDAARAEPVVIGGRPVLVVGRFDRELVDGQHLRIHQEDACQALGLDPSMKYQALNRVGSYQAIARVLRLHAADSERELANLGRFMTFTVAIGNTDAHLRNHSLLHRSGTVTLAPIYDVAPTVDFVKTKQVALWVGGQPMLSAIKFSHLTSEMTSWGVRESAAQIILSILESLREALPAAATSISTLPKGMAARSVRRVELLLPT